MSSWTVTYALPAPVYFPVKNRCALMARSYCVCIGRFAPKAELFFSAMFQFATFFPGRIIAAISFRFYNKKYRFPEIPLKKVTVSESEQIK